MKRRILVLLSIVLTDVARLEAHAFLKNAEPGVGSTVHTSPNEVRIRFSKTSNPPLAESRCSTRPGRKWTDVISTWIAQIIRYCTFLFHRSKRERTRLSGARFLPIHTRRTETSHFGSLVRHNF
jgi:hypothetical protein